MGLKSIGADEIISDEVLSDLQEAYRNHDIFGPAWDMVDRVADHYGLDARVGFHNGVDCQHHRSGSTHIIFFSCSDLMDAFDNGYEDYDAGDLIPDPAPDGINAVYLISLHEAAHMVVSAQNRKTGDHDNAWRQTFADLIQEFLPNL